MRGTARRPVPRVEWPGESNRREGQRDNGNRGGGSDHLEPCTRLCRALKVIAKIWPLFCVRWEAIGRFEAEMRLILKGITMPAVLRGD